MARAADRLATRRRSTRPKYSDEYRERVLDLIERKAAGEEIAVQPAARSRQRCPDLMAALEASVAALRDKDGKGPLDPQAQKRRPPTEGVPRPPARAGEVAQLSEAGAQAAVQVRVRRALALPIGALRRGSALVLCDLFSSASAAHGNTRIHACEESRHRPLASTTPNRSTTRAESHSWRSSPSGADHGVVDRALYALENLEHRGAAGRRPDDEATAPGYFMQLPDAFLRAVAGVELPDDRPLRRRRLLPAA